MRKLGTGIAFLVYLLSAFAARAGEQPKTIDQVLDRIIASENLMNRRMRQYQPLVETYIQDMKADKDLGAVPSGDKYFLGRANFSKGVDLVSLGEGRNGGKRIVTSFRNFFSLGGMDYLPDGFLQMIFIDTNGFDKQHYKFDYVRREFLGEVRCLVFDVTPLPKAGKVLFLGRIWVEDQDFNIVRFNGAYTGGHGYYFHFDSWRTNIQPGLWLPTFVYSEDSVLHPTFTKRMSSRAQTRLWGYNLGHSQQEQELSKILIETPVSDETKTSNDLAPIQAQRAWDRQAEDNVVDRLQRIGLIAPRGEVDKILETVVNNLEVTNNLDIQPEIRCRVIMTTTLESFTLGHTIVLSRGLVDVLPDEASLATIIAHEMGHVLLGHRMDTQYAFFDQLLVEDKNTFRHFYFARDPLEEQAASQKGLELLRNSPYKDQLGVAGLFLQALESRQKEIPNLVSPHLGNRVPVVADLRSVATPDPKKNPQQIVALPIGGRIKLNPWNDTLEIIKNKPVGAVAEREKMPFEVTPFMPYLTRFTVETAKPAPPAQTAPADSKPAQPAQTAPADSKPAQPAQTAPGDSKPAQAAPSDSNPAQPAQATPVDSNPEVPKKPS
jgi:Peptidase family M48